MKTLQENPYSEEFLPYERLIERLYENFSSGDTLDNLATDRNSEDYTKILGLKEVPISEHSLVLDIAVGRSRYQANDFGVEGLKIVKADVDPKFSDVEKRNVLNISDSSEKYDELWGLHLMRYIDILLPPPVKQRVVIACQQLGLPFYQIYENLLTAFGLIAFREMLRVIKFSGRVRLGGYEHHFRQGKMIFAILKGISEQKLKGISISGVEVHDSEEKNIFFSKTSEYIQKNVDAYVIECLKKLVPHELLTFSWN